MTAEDPVLYMNKPYSLTLKGSVTLHYLDGQILNGEILAQDSFNIFLKVEDISYLIPRQQIRYITGAPEQMPEEETSPVVIVEASPETAVPVPSIPAEPEPTPPIASIPVEPEPQVAQFVEEEELPPVISNEDSSGTVVLPTITDQMLQVGSETNVSPPSSDESEDMGRTFVFPPATPSIPLTDTTERAGLSQPSVASASASLADLFETTSEMDGEATFILGAKAQAAISAHLVCTSGPHAGEVLQLKPGITTIGRSSDNSFALSKDKEVSRRHAIIAYEANKFVIQDQNSLNHTFVNNEEVKEPRPLADGDFILIGISTLKFQEG